MHTASSAMVNSVTITATGIEAMVETINDATSVTTKKVKTGYSKASQILITITNTPKNVQRICIFIYKYVLNRIRMRIISVKLIIDKCTHFIYNQFLMLLSYTNVLMELMLSFAYHIFLTMVCSVGSETIGQILYKIIEFATKFLAVMQINYMRFFSLKIFQLKYQNKRANKQIKSKYNNTNGYIKMNGHIDMNND
jgi:hypothetical protein